MAGSGRGSRRQSVIVPGRELVCPLVFSASTYIFKSGLSRKDSREGLKGLSGLSAVRLLSAPYLPPGPVPASRRLITLPRPFSQVQFLPVLCPSCGAPFCGCRACVPGHFPKIHRVSSMHQRNTDSCRRCFPARRVFFLHISSAMLNSLQGVHLINHLICEPCTQVHVKIKYPAGGK